MPAAVMLYAVMLHDMVARTESLVAQPFSMPGAHFNSHSLQINVLSNVSSLTE